MKQFKKIRKLGTGGMSEVYLVKGESNELAVYKQVRSREGVAKDQAMSCMHTEASLLAKFHHANIPSYLGCDAHGIYMTYIKGVPLSHMIQSDTKISKRVLREWLCECCDILDYVHKQGYAYLDMKPQNLMLDDDGTIVLIDFGSCVKLAMGNELVLALTPRISCARIATAPV